MRIIERIAYIIGVIIGKADIIRKIWCRISYYAYSGYVSQYFTKTGKNLRVSKYIKYIKGGTIGNNCQFGKQLWLQEIRGYKGKKYNPVIKIGDNCSLGDYNHIAAINSIKIGDGLLTGQFVLIEDHTHGDTRENNSNQRPEDRELVSKGGITIGNNVWLGDRVVVCANVNIGNGVIIGANSVVTHDIPSNCIAAGSPAKVIRNIE